MSFVVNPYRFAAGFTGFGNDSRDFDGTVDFITIPAGRTDFNYIHEDKVFTVAAWIKLDDYTTSAFQTIFDSRNYLTTTKGVTLAYDNTAANNAVAVYITHGTSGQFDFISINSQITDNLWHHVAVTGDGSDLTCYVDGSAVGSTASVTYTGVYGDASNPLTIGKRATTTVPQHYFAGLIADVRIYDADIGSTAIAGLETGTDYTTDLQGRWLGNADNLLDLSGNDRDGYVLAPLLYNATFGDASRYFGTVDDNLWRVDIGTSTASYNFVHESKEYSVACWVRLENHANNSMQTILGNTQASLVGNTAGFYVGYDNRSGTATKGFRFSVENEGAAANIDFLVENQIDADGEWHHVAWTSSGSGGTLRFYLDGVEQATTSAGTSNTYGDASYNLKIGRDVVAGNLQIAGYLADLRIYDDELTPTEITTIIGGTNVTGNLQSHWFLNANDLLDAGILAKNGTNTSTTHQTADAGTFDIDGPLD